LNYKKHITKHIPLIDSLASKRFPQSPLADEAVVYVLKKLQEDDGRRLEGYTGDARFSTYLSVVVMRLFEDFSRTKFGRLRPPAWLKRLGGMWLVLFKMLCMERKSFPQAVDEMVAYYQLSAKTSDQMGSTILSEIVDCGHSKGQTVASDGIEDLAGTEGQDVAAEFEESQRLVLFRALFKKLVTDEGDTSLFDLDFKLSGEEKMLLKLCYQDGIAVTKAGAMVGLSSHQVHGRMRRVLARIKKILEDSGKASAFESFLTV
jgi:RNA polymerase sigma factor (sigma-70 family)